METIVIIKITPIRMIEPAGGMNTVINTNYYPARERCPIAH